jgi:hypothetical protein
MSLEKKEMKRLLRELNMSSLSESDLDKLMAEADDSDQTSSSSSSSDVSRANPSSTFAASSTAETDRLRHELTQRAEEADGLRAQLFSIYSSNRNPAPKADIDRAHREQIATVPPPPPSMS